MCSWSLCFIFYDKIYIDCSSCCKKLKLWFCFGSLRHCKSMKVANTLSEIFSFQLSNINLCSVKTGAEPRSSGFTSALCTVFTNPVNSKLKIQIFKMSHKNILNSWALLGFSKRYNNRCKKSICRGLFSAMD